MKNRHNLLVLFFFFSSVFAIAQTPSVHPRITQAIDEDRRVTLRGNIHPLARAEYDRGTAPDNLPAERMLLLLQRAPEQDAALERLLEEQQIKSSPNYHKWLTPEEFGQQFGPADSDIQAVTGWLLANGFQVNRLTAGRSVVEFSGNAGLVRHAFRTEIHRFVHNGEEHWANRSDPQLPLALVPVVKGIVSLHNIRPKPLAHSIGSFERARTTGEVRPVFTITPPGFPTFYALAPADLATIYDLPSSLDGGGQTIAIVADSNINLADTRNFRNLFGLPANDPLVILNGPDPGLVPMAETEADVDVQWAGAVAPKATIDLVVSEDTETTAGVDLSALYIIDNNLAGILSVSFGVCEAFLGTAGNAFESNLWKQAAAQGITVIIAAGDSGSASCDNPNVESTAMFGLAVNGLASTAFNVTVGATDFDQSTNSASSYWNASNAPNTHSSAKSYIPETTLNDSCAQGGDAHNCVSPNPSLLNIFAGGGGPSSCAVSNAPNICVAGNPKPAWQTAGVGVPQDGVRDIPDLSFFGGDGAHGSFYVVCEADADLDKSGAPCDLSSPYLHFLGVGGTSLSAQVFAGVMALVDQHTGGRQGNANYVLYALAAQNASGCDSSTTALTNSNCIFYDVTKGNNSVPCAGVSPNCGSVTPNVNGVLVDPANSLSLAWATKVKYDLATGLGSANIRNLVQNWGTLAGSFKPTTTQLSLNGGTPVHVSHGASVPVFTTVAASSGSGSPSGEVSLLTSTGQSGGAFALVLGTSSSSARGNTMLLPGGSYTVSAHYPGDLTYGASDSVPGIPVVVTPENSYTQLGVVTFDFNTGQVTSSNAKTVEYGSPYVLRIDVLNSMHSTCVLLATGCPTGNVALTDNNAPLDAGTFKLNSAGFAEDQPIQLNTGSYNLQAAYPGDNSFAGSTSAVDAVTVTKATTSMTIASSVSTATFNENITFTATLDTRSSGVAPTGNISFFGNGTALSGIPVLNGAPGSAAGPASLHATLVTSFPSSGNELITASYAGDSKYAASSTPAGVNVAVNAFIITAAPNATIGAPGQSANVPYTLTAASGFSDSVTVTCSVPTTMTEATCAPSSQTQNPVVLGNPSLAFTGTLVITTTAAHTAVLQHGRWFVPGGGILLACAFLLGAPKLRRHSQTILGLVTLCALLVAGSLVGCGGGGAPAGGAGHTTDPGTPVGTYTVSVSATSANTKITQTTNLNVTVQ